MTLEFLWRGWSHGSMFLVGGLCFVLIGAIDRIFPKMPLLFQSVLGAFIVTVIEFISGLILNLYLGLGVWDYSHEPYSLLGQICPGYFFLWIIVSFGAVLLENGLRRGLFHEYIPLWRFL